MALKNNYMLWKLKIQGTQKNEGNPRSNSILVNYLCSLTMNGFIYYMQTILIVRVGEKSVLSLTMNEMLLPLPTLSTPWEKWPI